MNTNDNLRECTICYETEEEVYWPCHIQHYVCAVCQPRIHQCPSCAHPWGKLYEMILSLIMRVATREDYGRGCYALHLSGVEHEQEDQYRIIELLQSLVLKQNPNDMDTDVIQDLHHISKGLVILLPTGHPLKDWQQRVELLYNLSCIEVPYQAIQDLFNEQ